MFLMLLNSCLNSLPYTALAIGLQTLALELFLLLYRYTCNLVLQYSLFIKTTIAPLPFPAKKERKKEGFSGDVWLANQNLKIRGHKWFDKDNSFWHSCTYSCDGFVVWVTCGIRYMLSCTLQAVQQSRF